MYGSIFDCHTPAGGTAGILWVEARDAVKYPIAHQAAPHRELSGCQCQWCHGGEVLLESEVGMTVPGPHLALVFLTLLILFLQKECDEGWKPLFKMMPLGLSQVSQTDKYHMITLICGILKMTQMNLFMKQKQTHRQKTNLWFPKEKEGGRGIN